MLVWQKKFIWPNGMVIPWFIQFQTRIIQSDLLIFRDSQKLKKIVIVNHIFVSLIRRFPEGEYGRAWIVQSMDRVEVKTSFSKLEFFSQEPNHRITRINGM